MNLSNGEIWKIFFKNKRKGIFNLEFLYIALKNLGILLGIIVGGLILFPLLIGLLLIAICYLIGYGIYVIFDFYILGDAITFSRIMIQTGLLFSFIFLFLGYLMKKFIDWIYGNWKKAVNEYKYPKRG